MNTVEDTNIKPSLTIEVDNTNDNGDNDNRAITERRHTPRKIPTFQKSYLTYNWNIILFFWV